MHIATYPAYAPGHIAALLPDDGSGRAFQLLVGTNVVGRGFDTAFRLADPGVSRQHFDIRWDGHTAVLVDLGSSNGTTVNGIRIDTSWQLVHGDQIRVGSTLVYFNVG
ncbi:FHA domain-containing protein [Antrihabitans sp. YC3-6]|uniref:FHA domain-containing protein n=1 Tax=Antrihabitans stalagmiti TaxID=2799499 RepID=A0A934NQB0_9NOCA|nr:FHA domain-containing protein [Antrihabitans stalagmiti]MBJ8339340.1 FHA domain-containing protein [Antrihabitans stalagmiti]